MYVNDENPGRRSQDRKSTRLNSSHANISYAVFCLKKKNDPDCDWVATYSWPHYTELVEQVFDGCRLLCIFFFNDTATTEIYTLSLHDALPIYPQSISTRTSPERPATLDNPTLRK